MIQAVKIIGTGRATTGLIGIGTIIQTKINKNMIQAAKLIGTGIDTTGLIGAGIVKRIFFFNKSKHTNKDRYPNI
jgi:hypothetical protein